MKIKVITSFKPGTWDSYSGKGIKSIAEKWPIETDIVVYLEEQKPDYDHDRITWVDLIGAEPELSQFKKRHQNDPVACGKIQQIKNGVRRPAALKKQGGLDRDKESFLWDAVRFSNKVFCIINAVRNSPDHDYIVWIDADTYTHKPFSNSFLESLLPRDTMLTYLGREKGSQKIYPECGFVGYNLRHLEIQNFINDWERLYSNDEIFNLLEWHDSAVLWYLSKKYVAEKNVTINDIGHGAGANGHHVFVNSKLGEYIDHFKGEKRKISRRSSLEDYKTIQPYWRTI